MHLIKVENYEMVVADEAMLVKPIRRLWNADRSIQKERFYQQISYLYNMIDLRSPYSCILNEEERAKEIIAQEGLPKDFKPSPMLLEAMEIYRKLTVTPSQKLLEAALTGANTVAMFLKDPKVLTYVDGKGRPKYTISDVTRALKDVEGMVSTLQNLQKKVEQELVDAGKARGSHELTIFDDDTE